MGKLPEAIRDGKLHWPGSFELCEEQEVNYTYYNFTYFNAGEAVEEREFNGQYCRLEVTPPGVSCVWERGYQLGWCEITKCPVDSLSVQNICTTILYTMLSRYNETYSKGYVERRSKNSNNCPAL